MKLLEDMRERPIAIKEGAPLIVNDHPMHIFMLSRDDVLVWRSGGWYSLVVPTTEEYDTDLGPVMK